MEFKNPWIRYFDRNYDKVKTSILNRLKNQVPEMRDHSEGNLMIILVKIFSGITEQFNYYIDNMSRESFITTARLYSSLVKASRQLDYRIKSFIPSSVDVEMTALDDEGNEFPLGSDFVINALTEFRSESGKSFLSTEDITWPAGSSKLTVPVKQVSLRSDIDLGVTTTDKNQVFIIPGNYAHNSMTLRVGNDTWELKDTLGRSSGEDRHYIIDISAEKIPFIKFGDGINGAIPDGNQSLVAEYFVTEGVEGQVGGDSITTLQTNYNIPGVDSIETTNLLASSGGFGVESIEQIRQSLPLSLRTLDRAITKQDYKDIAKLAPGVNKSALLHECGGTVLTYISPVGGGIAQQALLNDVYNYMISKAAFGVELDIKPAGESYIIIDIEVTAKFRRDKSLTYNDILNRLLELYSHQESDINNPVRTSDIIAAVDNLEKVDYLKLLDLKLIPYARPVGNSLGDTNDNILNWDVKILNPKIEDTWRVEYSNVGFRIYKNNTYKSTVNINQQFSDDKGIMQFTIKPGFYNVGDFWEFTTYPNGKDIEVSDYSIPITRAQDLKIKVNEQFV